MKARPAPCRMARAAGAHRAGESSCGIGRSRHARPDPFRSERLGRELAGDGAIAHDDDPVAHGEQFVELLREQEQGCARGARLESAARNPSALRVSRPRVG